MEKSLSSPESHVLFASTQMNGRQVELEPHVECKNKLLPQAVEEPDAIYLIIRNICSDH